MDVSKTIPNVDNSTIEIASDENLRVKDSGITTAKIAANAVTKAKLSNANFVKSSNTNNYSTSSTTAVAVTGLSESITVNANRLVSICISNGLGLATGAEIVYVGSYNAYLEIYRDSTKLTSIKVNSAGPGCIPVFYDNPSAGTYTYSVKGYVLTSGTLFMVSQELVLIEL